LPPASLPEFIPRPYKNLALLLKPERERYVRRLTKTKLDVSAYDSSAALLRINAALLISLRVKHESL
jgi:hypothetical protein